MSKIIKFPVPAAPGNENLNTFSVKDLAKIKQKMEEQEQRERMIQMCEKWIKESEEALPTHLPHDNLPDNVTQITAYQPHLSGAALCLNCKYEWVAVVPVGAPLLECPECGLLKGVMNAAVHADVYLACNSCGCSHFTITPDFDAVCMLCGVLLDKDCV